MLSLEKQNQYFLTKSQMDREFEGAILRAIDCPLKLASIVSLMFDYFRTVC